METRRTVLVTGAASGIGAATAAALRTAGVEVVAVDVRVADADRYVECDLSSPASVDSAVAAAPARLDGVVNVAGIPGPKPADKVMAVNFLGARKLTEALFPRIREGGSVVNVVSVAGRDWLRRADVVRELVATTDFEAGLGWCRENAERWGKDPYTFSKQCLAAWTLRLAGRGLDRRIRVNSVSPGGVDTALTPAFRDQVGAEQFEWAVRQIGRQATPDEIAEVIEYLAIGASRWVNGADIIVDGGLVAGLVSGWIDASSSPAALARRRSATSA